MDRRENNYMEIDDGVYAQIDFLKQENDELQKIVVIQRRDILKLIAFLNEKDIDVPKVLLDRYVRINSDCQDNEYVPELL